jgi:hypothetical protein
VAVVWRQTRLWNGGAEDVAQRLCEMFGGSAGRKSWEVIKVGKCVGCEGVVGG